MIFRKITDIYLIPKYLVEQVPDMEVAYFYESLKYLAQMPSTLVELILNEELKIIGFAWMVIEMTSKNLHVNTVSLDKEYQGDGVVLNAFIEHMRCLLKGSQIKKVTWCTDRPAFYEKAGFKRSKQIFLEYDLIEGDTDGCEETKS